MAIQLLGLTGGIASGKSTVSGQLADTGAKILCADTIYHQLICPINGHPSPLALRIEQAFPGVLCEDGSLNRPKLGERVFGHSEDLGRLGSITHPAVAQEVARQVQALDTNGVERVIYDVPLLFERQSEGLFEGIIVVWVPQAIQLQRLIKREQISMEAAVKRLKSQLPLDSKKEKATWVIDNSGTPAQTRKEVDKLWAKIQGF